MLKTNSANNSMGQARSQREQWLSWLSVFVVAAGVLLLHLLTNTRYGFHRDELQFLSDALHLGWGYVAYPPRTPIIEQISMALLGISLEGFRLFSVLAQVAVVIAAGLIARMLGGRR